MGASKLQPALLGGLAIGVLSALPVINLANCCCAWILFGGGLAAYLTQQSSPSRISVADGAIVGLLAGAIGALIFGLLSTVLNLVLGPFQLAMMQRAFENSQDLPPELRAMMEGWQEGVILGGAWLMIMVAMLFVSSLFGMLGGLFGALIFGKDAPPPPPSGPTFTPNTFSPPPLPRGDV